MKTYPSDAPFNGTVGRTWRDSEPAFPRRPRAPEGAPNVVLVLLDDTGFGQADTFGGLIETPAMTRLADNGLRFTNFHTTAVCAPTRASLLSGHNHHDCGMGSVPEHATGYPGYDAFHPADRAGIAALLHVHGYTSLALGKWHNTPSEETGPTGPFDRWPNGPIFGFDHFYGVMMGETNQWYPALHRDRTPVDQPRLPEDGYHFSEDMVDEAIRFVSTQGSLAPDDPWMIYLSFGATHAPHHVAPEWVEPYAGRFDMGWDRYREIVIERQKELGVVPAHAELAPPIEGVPRWDDLDADRKRLFTRMAEVYAGFLTHTDHQIGRLADFLEQTGQLDDTLFMVIVGDNGASGEGGQDGLYNEMTLFAGVEETLEHKLERIDNLGLPGSHNHYPIGWAMAGNTPYRLCKQYVHNGGVRNPLIVHWPNGFESRGGIRHQFHHVVDVVPTILAAARVEQPREIAGVAQAPLAGTPMNYAFDDGDAPTAHPRQYFEMFANRAIVDGRWKAVTFNGRMPWEAPLPERLEQQRWELYDLEADPTETTDLMAGRDLADRDDPIVRKRDELVELWWAEAGRHNVLPLDDRLFERLLGRTQQPTEPETVAFYRDAVRIPERVAPNTKNRSWTLTAQIEVPGAGASGPVCALGGDTNGWSLYLDADGVPCFCYNLTGQTLTYIRGSEPLAPGSHELTYSFTRTEDRYGAGGTARLSCDGSEIAAGEIERTVGFGYSVDGTLDVGCDKGAPVTPEYPPLADFSGTVEKVVFVLEPDIWADESTAVRERVEAAVVANDL